MSTANDIALAVHARLTNVLVANGYDTDAGARVFRGRRRIDPSHLPCLVIVERPDRPDKQSGQRDPSVKISKEFVVEGFIGCNPDNPNDAGHELVSDIKRAIWGSQFTFGSSQKVYAANYEGSDIKPRDDGTNTVTALVSFSVEYVEQLSNP